MPKLPRPDGKNPRTQASRKYNDKNYERIYVTVRSGDKEIVNKYAEDHGETVNGLINRLLKETIPGLQ